MKLLEKKTPQPKKEVFLKKSLLEAQKNVADAYARLDLVKEQDLIDSYIYELNAAYLRYRVLLREMKALTLDEEHQTRQTDSTDHSPIGDLDIPAPNALLPESNIS